MKLSLVATAIVAGTAHAGITRDFDRGPATPDLPLDHRDLQQTNFIDQVHVTGGSSDAATITWTTNATSHGKVVVCKAAKSDNRTPLLRARSAAAPQCQSFQPTHEVYSFLLDPPSWFPGESPCQGSENYTNPDCYYTSAVIHTAHVRGSFVTPSTTYTYTFEDDTDGLQFNFTTPPAPSKEAAIKFAIVGDLGQTGNSSQTVDGIYSKAVGPDRTVDAVLHAGDLAYADGFAVRWDSYARLGQKLWANTVTAYTGGNHEVSTGGENWGPYERRYPNDHDLSGSDSFLWYSFEAGAAHVISLCSYAAFEEGSLQHTWLLEDLKSIDRSKTPWVIAMWHTPWYTSNAHHPRSEGAAMMEALEDVLHGQVDVVFNGHVHAYERSESVYKNESTSAADGGITYITIGDGGNREEFAIPWVDPQPSWSVIREFAYGYGELEIYNSSVATWRWLRNDKQGSVGDEYTFRK